MVKEKIYDDDKRVLIIPSWFNNEKNKEITIPAKVFNLLTRENDILVYIMALNIYPNFEPQFTYQSYIKENNIIWYIEVVGNNYQTHGHFQFIIRKGD